ncbi:uncharacterized protein METZ01_LOCUS355264, partial [marine metagenome]
VETSPKRALANGWPPGTIAAPQVGNRQPKFFNDAGVVELVDTRDLKSLSREGVPVQVRPPVPYCPPKSSGLLRAGFVTIPRAMGILEIAMTLGMLVLLQAVLGFDNLLYISLESKRAPEAQQSSVRKWGI